MNVRETPWAKSTRDGYDHLAESIPAAAETAFVTWQRRVDSEGAFPTENGGLTSLFAITATRMNVSNENGRKVSRMSDDPADSLTFLVAAWGSRSAFDRVKEETDAHYPGETFCFSLKRSGPVILRSATL